MKKIILTVILIIIGAGLVIFGLSIYSERSLLPDTTQCDSMKNDEKASCYISLAVDSKNDGICNKLLDLESTNNEYPQYLSEQCKFSVYYSVNNTDPLKCEKFSEPSFKEGCYQFTAIFSSNPEICLNIPLDPVDPNEEASLDECLGGVASKKGNPEICKNLKEKYGIEIFKEKLSPFPVILTDQEIEQEIEQELIRITDSCLNRIEYSNSQK